MKVLVTGHEGYTAHPSDSTEIESSIYTIFKETVIPI